jgi:chitin synthase
MSGANSTTAALGRRMTPAEVGRQKAAEANIVEFLREAGNALDATSGAAAVPSLQMPRKKILKTRFVDRASPKKSKLMCNMG